MTKRVIALGTFDGVHLGHRQILNKMLEIAGDSGLEPLIYTFSNHPLTAFGKAPKLIMRDEERIRLLGEFAPVEAVTFDLEYAAMTPEKFAVQLVEKYNASVAVAGFNYTFGAKGLGNMDLLSQLGQKQGFDVVEVPPFVQDGMPVSSSRIRECVGKGKVETASDLLGRNFEIWVKAMEKGCCIKVEPEDGIIRPTEGKYRVFADLKGEGILEAAAEEVRLTLNKRVEKGNLIKISLKSRII